MEQSTPQPEPKKKVPAWLIIIGILLLYATMQAVFSTDKVKPREARVKACFSAWDGAHMNLERWVKDHINDPGSYEHVETRYTDTGGNINLVLRFRAKNGFGGVVQGVATAVCDDNCNLIGTPVILN